MEPAESSAQPTSSVVRTMEAEDDTSAKRQKLMAGILIFDEIDVDVNIDEHELVVLAGMRTTKESGFSGSLIGTRNTTELRVDPA